MGLAGGAAKLSRKAFVNRYSSILAASNSIYETFAKAQSKMTAGVTKLKRPFHHILKVHAQTINVLSMYSITLSETSTYTVSQKTTLMLHTITSMHINRFWQFFGRDVAERVCYQLMICYPTSPN